jgi:MoaA/NifB/PqqE/SkfB family radical SAM enzyme
MPLIDFLNILDRVATRYHPDKVMIAVTGGEPLLRKDLEICGREFYSRGFPWGMVTNGYLLTSQRLQALCRAGLRSVTISLDGLEDAHTWLRGNKNRYTDVHRAILACSEQSDLVFDIVTCVNKRNLEELEKIRDLLISLGVKKWRLFSIFPKGRAKDREELILSNTEFIRMLDFIADCRKHKSIEASYGCEGFLGRYEGKVRDSYFFVVRESIFHRFLQMAVSVHVRVYEGILFREIYIRMIFLNAGITGMRR